jgi:assimilatory nitrate reductase catalytic subunit
VLHESQPGAPRSLLFECALFRSGPDGVDDAAPVICACFGVGLNIRRAIVSGALSGAEEIGKALRAGTNCGSCLPELRKIIQARVPQTS